MDTDPPAAADKSFTATSLAPAGIGNGVGEVVGVAAGADGNDEPGETVPAPPPHAQSKRNKPTPYGASDCFLNLGHLFWPHAAG